eukprot:1013282-Rhodomonas_salina.1
MAARYPHASARYLTAAARYQDYQEINAQPYYLPDLGAQQQQVALSLSLSLSLLLSLSSSSLFSHSLSSLSPPLSLLLSLSLAPSLPPSLFRFHLAHPLSLSFSPHYVVGRYCISLVAMGSRGGTEPER